MSGQVVVNIRVRRPTGLLDIALAGLLCVLDLSLAWDHDRTRGTVGVWAVPLYAAAGYLLLVWRRRFPGAVFVATVAHSLLAWVLAPGYVPTLSVWLALYTLAARSDRRRALLGLLAAFLPSARNVVCVVSMQPPQDRALVLVVSVMMFTLVNVVIFGAGRWSAWTVRQPRIVAEQSAAEATSTERNRIARDLHDIVAHSVTLMLLQAGGAARLLHTDPARAEDALRHVDDLGQEAIVELRRMLGLLDTGSRDGHQAPEPFGLADIGEIVERTTVDDLRVDLSVVGDPIALDPGVDLSAYRIVQEALTNAARYADRRHPVHLDVRWFPHSVEISVVNHRTTARRPRLRRLSVGHGLIGMRERAHAVGGEITAGPAPDGRFAVAVTLPVAAHVERLAASARDA